MSILDSRDDGPYLEVKRMGAIGAARRSRGKGAVLPERETVREREDDSARVRSRSRISSKGQITLPIQVRDRLGVGTGDQVEFFFDGERTVVKPVRTEANPFSKWVGIAGKAPADFDPIASQREMRGWDEYDHENYG